MMRASRVNRPSSRIAACFQIQRAAAIHRQSECDIGPGHRQPLDDVEGGNVFGPRAFKEFQPRRRGIEKFAHLHPRAMLARRAKGGGTRAIDGAAFHVNLKGLAAVGAADDGKPRHRADGR